MPDLVAALTRPVSPEESLLLSELAPFLRKNGWMESRKVKRPIDGEGQPLPWYTYAAIDFLKQRITSEMTVFEFGSGNSTLWWAERALHVTAVEHHAKWARRMSSLVPANATLDHVPLELNGEYSRSALRSGRRYHIIVIDGRDRVNCALHSEAALREDGVIIWDNSERPRYREGYSHLRESGYRRLDFRGHGPINTSAWQTAVFYRSENCLGL